MFEKISKLYYGAGISAKITWICTAFFLFLIVTINLMIWYCISYTLCHPAEATIKFSIERIQELLKEIQEDPANFHPESIREPLVAGVVLRVVDNRGFLLIDTDVNYPPNETFNQNIMESPPYLARRRGLQIAKIGNALVYRAEQKFNLFKEDYTFYFYRTITSQTKVLDNLQLFMFFIDVFCIIFAAVIGYLISQKVLRPVKSMTDLANKIISNSGSEHVTERIPLTPADDELTELAKTFNAMLDRMQGDITKQKKFVSDASHELRTPLTVIEGYVEVLEKYGEANQSLRGESVEAIRSEAQNMKSLIENLLFLARSDQKTLKYNKQKIHLDEVIDKAFQRMTIYEKDHDISLTKNEPAQIYADESTILQMLRILLDNAAKYTPKGGKIEFSSIVETNHTAIVQVSDYGIGIAPSDIDKIFERGTRLDENSLVKNAKGCGIGLAIAKVIADNHDIRIDVDSKLGEGTTFTLTIPLAD